MLHIFYGEDDYSIRQALDGIKKSIGDPEALMTNTTVLDGRQATVEELRSACETVPFLADKRLVVVEGLLERFESRGRNSRKKSARQSDQPEEYKTFADVMKQLPDFTELVIIGGAVNEKNPLLLEIKSAAKMKKFSLLYREQLRAWIEQRVKEAGGNIARAAIDLLARLVGSDLWIMANEIDKLISYTGGRAIDEIDVRAVVSYAQEASIFAMIDAVMEFRVKTAQQLLQQLFREGAMPPQILVMLSRQVRIIFQIKEMRADGRSRVEIQNKLGITHDFLLNKAWEQADRYSPARVRDVYHRLLETDVAIKTGRLDGEIALNILITELGQRGALNIV